jgi:hypothetical protein
VNFDERRRHNALMNLGRVRQYFVTHPGCEYRECAVALELSFDQVKRAVQKMRRQWQGADDAGDSDCDALPCD